MAKKQATKAAPKAPARPEVKVPGTFPRFTFLRMAKAFGYTEQEAAELFAVGVAEGIIKPQGRIGILGQIESYKQEK